MEASDVFTGLRRAVLLHILTQSQHKALAVVEDIDFLPLLLGEIQRQNHRCNRYHGAQRHEHYAEQPYLPEGCFDIF